MADYKDGLNFPDLTPVDHARHCQQYTSGEDCQSYVLSQYFY